MPAMELNSSTIRWEVAPEPDEEYEYLSGFALSSAMNSFRLFTGSAGLTTNTNGLIANRLIVVKSLRGS